MKKRIALLLAAILLFTCLLWSVTPAMAAPAEASPADGCKILEYVDEEVFEEADHLGRMEEEETLSNYVFLNKDGTRTAYYLDEAVKFVDTDGKIKEKDITLQSVLGGYATTQNDVTVTLPITMSNGVNLSYNDYQISLIPEGGTSSAPQIVNNAAEYTDFYGENTILKYTPTLSGVKEDIILESYTGQNTFTFTLNTNGLAVYHTKEDRYYLAPGKGTDPVYWLGALEIYDSALNMGTGTMTVEPMMAGQKYKITITVDTDWLTSANTVYPVTVDPTIDAETKNYSTSGSGYIDDAPIYSGSSAIKGRNYGSNIYNCAGYMDTTYGMGRTVVRLTNMINDSTYQNLTASSIISVKFYVYDASGAAATTVDLYPLTENSSWTENNVTWNSINASSTATYFSTRAYASASIGRGSKGEFDITELVQKWKVGVFDAQCGFVLIGKNQTTKRGLYSSEHSTTSKRPCVSLTYGLLATDNNGQNLNRSPFYSIYASNDYFRNTVTESGSDDSTSGEPDLVYHTDGLQLRSNCYGYAFRFYCNESRSVFNAYLQQPGEFADKTGGYTLSVAVGTEAVTEIVSTNAQAGSFLSRHVKNGSGTEDFKTACMLALMQADADELGYTVTEYTGSSIPTASDDHSKRLIALVISPNGYHFYMQHSDNTWSHKDGFSAPRDTCYCHGEQLLNSTIRVCSTSGDYANGFVRFFYITKSVEDTAHYAPTNSGNCPKTDIVDDE